MCSWIDVRARQNATDVEANPYSAGASGQQVTATALSAVSKPRSRLRV